MLAKDMMQFVDMFRWLYENGIGLTAVIHYFLMFLSSNKNEMKISTFSNP